MDSPYSGFALQWIRPIVDLSYSGFVLYWICLTLDLSHIGFVLQWIRPTVDSSYSGFILQWIRPTLDSSYSGFVAYRPPEADYEPQFFGLLLFPENAGRITSANLCHKSGRACCPTAKI